MPTLAVLIGTVSAPSVWKQLKYLAANHVLDDSLHRHQKGILPPSLQLSWSTVMGDQSYSIRGVSFAW